MATIEERFCRDDGDCSDKQYCYHVSERCVDYTQCNRYNRLENHEKKSRDPSQCGPCLTGYVAEKLGTGEMALFCRKTNAQQDIPVVKLDNTMIIYSVMGTFLFGIIAVFGILLFKRRRSKRQRNMVKPHDELGVMEPTAPPLENSPFIRCKEGSSPVPFNNNKILKDKNDLVRAVGFIPPSWVRTNSNYEYDMSNDNIDAIGQQHPVSEPTDNRSNNLMPEQLAHEVTNGNLAGYEVEQADNSLNTILVQANNPSSSNDSTQENNNNNNNNGSTSESKDGMKITDLTSKITSMRDTLQSEKQTLEYKNHVLSKHLDHITELDAEKNKFLEECQQLELQRNKLKTCKRNIQDQELLDQGRRKYALYRELTGIRWDFGKLKENITGNIYKGVYIHHFSYSNEENTKDLNNLLWQEIYQSVIHNEHKNTYDKENTIQNK